MFTVLRRIWPFVAPYRARMFAAVVAMLGVEVLAYSVPLAIGYVTDRVYPQIAENPAALAQLWIVGALLLTVAILRGASAHLMIRFYWGVAERSVRDIRNALYHKLQHLDMDYYDRSRTGDLMSRATYDLQILRNFLAFGIEHRVRIVLIAMTVFVIMVWQSPRLALLIYTVIPLFVAAIIYYSSKMRTAVSRQQQHMGQLNSRLQESVTGIRTIKAFAVEEPEIRRFEEVNREMLARDLAASLPQAYLNPILLTTEGVGALVLIVGAAQRVISGELSLGTLVAFISYLALMGFPLRILAFNTSLISLARGASERLQEILTHKDQLQRAAGSHRARIRGDLRFENVSFRYPDGPCVLENVDFTVPKGSHVGLFGLTGSGKSSLISLIPRFYLPTEGRILVDGVPLERWDLYDLRNQVGTVLQETFLFSATIRENIGFSRPDAGRDAIEAAARAAEIHDFIMSLPEGYETLVGEHGVGLSGGQKQRIAIARTLVQDPRILILDDCTSSLDAVTERQIQRQLKALMAGRTTIVVAQRIATLSLADRVIVLDQGAVQAIDTHSALVEHSPIYRSTWLQQRAGAVATSGEESAR